MQELETSIKISVNSDTILLAVHKVDELLREKSGEYPKKWLDSKGTMELMGISKNTLQKLRDAKAIKVSKPPHIGKFYYERASILEYLDKHAINPE